MRVRTIAAAGAVALVVGGLPVGTASGQTSNAETFDFTGAEQTWQVPENVCEVDVLANGASGGDGPAQVPNGAEVTRAPISPGGPGGIGGMVEATIEVTPGEMLRISVGGQGEPGQSNQSPGRPAYQGGAGGWNGGGEGGAGYQGSGAGGGGSTDIRRGGDALTDRVLVAGGGGGSGAFSYQFSDEGAAARLPTESGLGGFGGGDNTPDGTAGGNANEGATGGGAGTQTGGGSAGLGHPDGGAGTLGLGGDAGPIDETFGGGAGGGGGYFGGGAGGGGEEPAGDTKSERIHATFEGAGGGGGSSFGPANALFSYALGPATGSLFVTWAEDPGCDQEPTTTTLAPTTTAAAKAQALAPTFTG